MTSLVVSGAPMILLVTTLAHGGATQVYVPVMSSEQPVTKFHLNPTDEGRSGGPSLPARLEQGAAAATQETATPGLFEKGAVGLEFGFGLLGEAWNLNSSREWLADGTLAVWWAFVDRASLVTQVHATRVFQQASRNAFVTGLTPFVRFQVLDRESLDLFTELGAGASWSDTVVPPRGTRFNYVGVAGLGVSRRLTRQTHLTIGVRWLHLSNNGREGRDRNPDIQALGGYGAVTIGL